MEFYARADLANRERNSQRLDGGRSIQAIIRSQQPAIVRHAPEDVHAGSILGDQDVLLERRQKPVGVELARVIIAFCAGDRISTLGFVIVSEDSPVITGFPQITMRSCTNRAGLTRTRTGEPTARHGVFSSFTAKRRLTLTAIMPCSIEAQRSGEVRHRDTRS